MRREGWVLIVAALALVACSGDDGASSSTSVAADPFAAAMAEQSTEGVTSTATSPEGDLVVSTLSTRADAVTGGDVYVGLGGEVIRDGASWQFTIDGEPVEDDLVAIDPGAMPFGVVEGMADGDHLVEVTAGDQTAALAITNHPLTGPVFSGPQLEPWICHTEEAGLGEPLDDDCSADSVTTTETIGDGADAQEITMERGVIDRGIYTIWIPEGWNRRLVYRFGGGCGTTYGQGFDLGTGMDADLLSRGYALATNTLDTFQTICNPVVSAEAALMTREHFIESFGLPEFTIGDGGSGGAIQQLAVAQNQPGLLDALSPAAPFPDALSIAPGVSDCGLLVEYYTTPAGSRLSEEQRAAINGHLTSGTCASWDRLFVGGIDPTDGCDPAIPAEDVYSADNVDGVRCTLQDSNVNVFGTDSDTGFARRVLSSEGIQYGLEAFRAGVIDAEEFVTLNEEIGGWDIDGNIVQDRTMIDAETAALGYEVGAITGEGPLQELPIILRSPYTDPFGDIHTRYHAFSIRERLRVAGGDNPNLVLWTSAAGGGDLVGTLTGDVGGDDPIAILDQWLTTGERPATAVNQCTLPDGEVLTGGWELYDEPGPCQAAFPVMGDPRTAAGGPISGDVISCALAPLDEIDADLDLSDEQRSRLGAVFPTGVCDWTQPGRGQQPPATSWPDYGP
jgi:Tannase-like family of unknown function (DUF6351)